MTYRLLEDCTPYSYVDSCRKLNNTFPFFIPDSMTITSLLVVKAISNTSYMTIEVSFYD